MEEDRQYDLQDRLVDYAVRISKFSSALPKTKIGLRQTLYSSLLLKRRLRWSQIATTSFFNTLPPAFFEHGAIMAVSVLISPKTNRDGRMVSQPRYGSGDTGRDGLD
ncbi:MAG: hypothetical protein P9M08_08570 [Candidatus Erginobacter occultus]|nr:hypothetical protein [Candidatus Erginobacter occultus]